MHRTFLLYCGLREQGLLLFLSSGRVRLDGGYPLLVGVDVHWLKCVNIIQIALTLFFKALTQEYMGQGCLKRVIENCSRLFLRKTRKKGKPSILQIFLQTPTTHHGHPYLPIAHLSSSFCQSTLQFPLFGLALSHSHPLYQNL